MKTKIIAVLGATAILTLSAPQKQPDEPPVNITSLRHGTINVVLANRKGAVVETDSQLSNAGSPMGYGEKLFQIDDHTVCAIAGFYAAPLPVFAGSRIPAPSTVPAMIQQYLDERKGKLGSSMNAKMDSVVEILDFDLDFVVNTIDAVSRHSPTEQDTRHFRSTITLVGYENGHIKILQTSLTPALDRGYLYFRPDPYQTTLVNNRLQYITAGLDAEVQELLSDATALGNTRDPILSNYYSSVNSTHGESLNVHDMELIANEMVRTATRFHRGEVGGPRQIAILQGGKITDFDEPIVPNPPQNLQMAGIIMNPSFIHDRFGIGINEKPEDFTMPLFVDHGDFEGSDNLRIFQKLDYAIFTDTTFRKCQLYYTGSPLAIFDASNKVDDCVLEAPGVDPNLPFIKRLKKDFPQLFMKRPTYSSLR